jgi:hypothetical protein
MSNCPINEQTGDGAPVGKCDFFLEDGKICPRHGDVSEALALFEKSRVLTLENDLRFKRGEPLLGMKSDVVLKESDVAIEAWPPAPDGGMQIGVIPNGVKITHIETGLSVTCADHRSQHKNKDTAIKRLSQLLSTR